jgi:hypothetical protein
LLVDPDGDHIAPLDASPNPDVEEARTGQCAGVTTTNPLGDSYCQGNVGCTALPVVCGACFCSLCWNETCLDGTCDDGGLPQCVVQESDCGRAADGCGGFDTPVYGGDPGICESGCATAESTCAEMRQCLAGQQPLDDAALCQATCSGCGNTDCSTLCAATAGCQDAVLAATACTDINDGCPPPPPNP